MYQYQWFSNSCSSSGTVLQTNTANHYSNFYIDITWPISLIATMQLWCLAIITHHCDHQSIHSANFLPDGKYIQQCLCRVLTNPISSIDYWPPTHCSCTLKYRSMITCKHVCTCTQACMNVCAHTHAKTKHSRWAVVPQLFRVVELVEAQLLQPYSSANILSNFSQQ